MSFFMFSRSLSCTQACCAASRTAAAYSGRASDRMELTAAASVSRSSRSPGNLGCRPNKACAEL